MLAAVQRPNSQKQTGGWKCGFQMASFHNNMLRCYTFPRDQRDPEAFRSSGWSRFESLLRTRVLAAISHDSHAMLSPSQDWSGYSWAKHDWEAWSDMVDIDWWGTCRAFRARVFWSRFSHEHPAQTQHAFRQGLPITSGPLRRLRTYLDRMIRMDPSSDGRKMAEVQLADTISMVAITLDIWDY